MPKLLDQGSAPDVALTCTQLRSLCYHSVQHLDFYRRERDACEGEDPACSYADGKKLEAHFPNCRSIRVCWADIRATDVSSGMLGLLHTLV